MITCTTKKELRDELDKLSVPNVLKDMVYDNVVLGRTYTPGRGKRNQRVYSEHIPGHGDFQIAGQLYSEMSAAALERSRCVDLRDTISRSAQRNIARNHERYGMAVSDATHAALRIAEAFEGDLTSYGRAMAAELVAVYASVQRDAVVAAERARGEGKQGDVSSAANRVSGNRRTTSPLRSAGVVEEYDSGAVRLHRKEQEMARRQDARI